MIRGGSQQEIKYDGWNRGPADRSENRFDNQLPGALNLCIIGKLRRYWVVDFYFFHGADSFAVFQWGPYLTIIFTNGRKWPNFKQFSFNFLQNH